VVVAFRGAPPGSPLTRLSLPEVSLGLCRPSLLGFFAGRTVPLRPAYPEPGPGVGGCALPCVLLLSAGGLETLCSGSRGLLRTLALFVGVFGAWFSGGSRLRVTSWLLCLILLRRISHRFLRPITFTPRRPLELLLLRFLWFHQPSPFQGDVSALYSGYPSTPLLVKKDLHPALLT